MREDRRMMMPPISKLTLFILVLILLPICGPLLSVGHDPGWSVEMSGD